MLEAPVNVLRLALHPDGVAPRMVNFAQLRATLLLWLGRQAVSTGDPALAARYEELIELPGGEPASYELAAGEVAVPLRIRSGESVLSFISTITTFARATDITRGRRTRPRRRPPKRRRRTHPSATTCWSYTDGAHGGRHRRRGEHLRAARAGTAIRRGSVGLKAIVLTNS